MSHDLSWMTSFSRVFVWKHQKMCCSILQWSDVGTSIWCRTCTVRFFRSLLRIFSSFLPIWVCEMKVLWKVASSCAKDLKPVFLDLVKYSMKNFITTRQYLVNLMCNCWFRMCTKFHKKTGLDLIVNINYHDKIRSFWSVFVDWSKQTECFLC